MRVVFLKIGEIKTVESVAAGDVTASSTAAASAWSAGRYDTFEVSPEMLTYAATQSSASHAPPAGSQRALNSSVDSGYYVYPSDVMPGVHSHRVSRDSAYSSLHPASVSGESAAARARAVTSQLDLKVDATDSGQSFSFVDAHHTYAPTIFGHDAPLYVPYLPKTYMYSADVSEHHVLSSLLKQSEYYEVRHSQCLHSCCYAQDYYVL